MCVISGRGAVVEQIFDGLVQIGRQGFLEATQLYGLARLVYDAFYRGGAKRNRSSHANTRQEQDFNPNPLICVISRRGAVVE